MCCVWSNVLYMLHNATTGMCPVPFQAAVIDVLLRRVLQATKETGVCRLALSGGVAANSELRRVFSEHPGLETFLPPRSRCTDNGAMIANVGRLRLLRGQRDPLSVSARPSWQPGA